MSDDTLARREFLKTTGAVVVGLSVVDKVGAQSPAGGAPPAERGLASGPPDAAQVDSYVAIHPDNTVTIYSGYVELGQGGPTSLRQVAAEELDLELGQVKDVRADTFVSTNGFTAASRTAGIGSVELRAALAEARRVLLGLASERLKAPPQDLSVTKGVVSVRADAKRSVSYADLLGGRRFNRQYEPVLYQGGIELPRKGLDNAIPKRREDYRIVGTRVPRPDIAEKIKGTYEYVQHVRVPGMLHGRVIWPRGQGAHAISNPTVVSIDEASVKGIPGVQIVRRGNLVGVVAPREWDAIRAARQLKVTWAPFADSLPGHEGLFDSFRSAKTSDATDTNTGDVTAALSRGAHTLSATYRGPYQSHGPMAPNCAVADVSKDGALVMCSDQGIYQTRNGVARLLGMPVEKIRVQYYAGSNTYGSSCYRDAAEAAAVMSQEVGKPVRLQFSREDEHGWDNYGPAHLADLRASVDANGKLLAYDYQAWGHTGGGMNTSTQLALATSPPVTTPQGGFSALYSVHLSQTDMYDVPNRQIVNHRVVGGGYLRTGPLRAPMDPSVFFAQEGMMDELAHAAGLDPYEFRKRNISHRRWLGVLKAATDAAKWTPRVAASNLSSARVVRGRGIGLGTHHLPQNQGDRVTFAAAVVDIEVNKDNGIVVAKHVYGAMDCGLAINPGIVESQIVGMSVHGASLALKEEVEFNRTNVTSLDWNSYRTIRCGEHPSVTPIVIQQLHEKSSGAGEEVLPAVVAAIGNAFFDATGVRIRQYPLTPRRVLAALKSATGQPGRSA
ncbi:MAG TPA: molybdopterin cofactor-binding domain-containing protein [Vicinamibacterales bacterium]|nr:molybdopterin cofactor-binding domain-containing protein [Vicinamibacterales bacterium]